MWARLNNRVVFASILFIISVFILALKLLQPSTINIYIGENSTPVAQIPGFYTQMDLAIVLIFSVIIGGSGTFILLYKSTGQERSSWKLSLEERRREWEDISRMLKDDERKVYQAILDAGGIINQSELPEKTGLSKTSISRALDLLESKGLVERKRRGMGNVVILK